MVTRSATVPLRAHGGKLGKPPRHLTLGSFGTATPVAVSQNKNSSPVVGAASLPWVPAARIAALTAADIMLETSPPVAAAAANSRTAPPRISQKLVGVQAASPAMEFPKLSGSCDAKLNSASVVGKSLEIVRLGSAVGGATV